MIEDFNKGSYTTSSQVKKEEKKQKTLKSKPNMSSSKLQPSSQATQNQLLMTFSDYLETLACNDFDGEPAQETKNQRFSDADKNIQPLHGSRGSKQEQILAKSREDMAKLILILIEKLQEQEVHITQLEKEIE